MSGDLEQSPAYELHQALSAAEIRLLSNQAKDTVLQAWEEMVDHNRLFLLEVCCAEDSVLTDQCQQIFGEGTAERIAHWNGGDIETFSGRQHIAQLTKRSQRSYGYRPSVAPSVPYNT